MNEEHCGLLEQAIPFLVDEPAALLFEEKIRQAEAKALAAKQDRISQAEEQFCSGCDMIGKCDPDDYLCIVCRDGREAVPPGYAHYWRRPDAEAA